MEPNAEGNTASEAYELKALLESLCARQGSDLHLTAGAPPHLRIDGVLTPVDGPRLKPDDTKRLAYEALSEYQIELFERENELDFSFGFPGLSRFRGNLFVQRGCVALAVRRIPHQIPTFEELGIPPRLADLSLLPKGLVLVTGATGSGKSTTLAAMIDRVNRERHAHILTIEDPIEFLYAHRKSLVNQRQVHGDTQTFNSALIHVLRQDPDVVLVGEIRDTESIEAALTIAETGHLVMATLHTGSCAQTIQRLVDVFPSYQQDQVRMQLSLSLQAILAQQLIPRPGGGRALAVEIMICTPAVRALIRDNKPHQLDSVIQTGGRYGMQTMNQALSILVKSGQITREEALVRTVDAQDLERLL